MTKIVDLRNLSELKNAIDENTKLVFVETPSNPNLDVLDIQGCADLIHEVNGKSYIICFRSEACHASWGRISCLCSFWHGSSTLSMLERIATTRR